METIELWRINDDGTEQELIGRFDDPLDLAYAVWDASRDPEIADLKVSRA